MKICKLKVLYSNTKKQLLKNEYLFHDIKKTDLHSSYPTFLVFSTNYRILIFLYSCLLHFSKQILYLIPVVDTILHFASHFERQ